MWRTEWWSHWQKASESEWGSRGGHIYLFTRMVIGSYSLPIDVMARAEGLPENPVFWGVDL